MLHTLRCVLPCLVLLITLSPAMAENLTKPDATNATMVDMSEAPERVNDKFPLSDQENRAGWVLRKDLSDEFRGPFLDARKWHDHNPTWKGRKPTFFHPNNISMEDGELVFRINRHGKERLPHGYTDSSGFVRSKSRVLYGYFEAEMKLMDAPWVSGFWMHFHDDDWWTEIDICENCPGSKGRENELNSNVHVFYSPLDQGNVKEHFSMSKTFRVPFQLQEDYHVWGLYWDEKVIRFYIDGVMFREIENTHWHQSLGINFNNESNKWFGALPDDRTDRDFRVRYFRVWQRAE